MKPKDVWSKCKLLREFNKILCFIYTSQFPLRSVCNPGFCDHVADRYKNTPRQNVAPDTAGKGNNRSDHEQKYKTNNKACFKEIQLGDKGRSAVFPVWIICLTGTAKIQKLLNILL
ncbi:hypothetical protein AMECASPLE_035465 [Ameca splendens]|uniref:Uncharacterized protein n=1 Tax=Ameca splendens TaxID=208324 RepID=A0ABV0ZGG4_9TELE